MLPETADNHGVRRGLQGKKAACLPYPLQRAEVKKLVKDSKYQTGDWVAVFATGGAAIKDVMGIRGDEGDQLTFEKIWAHTDGSEDEDRERVAKAVTHTLNSDPKYIEHLKGKGMTPGSAATKITKLILDRLRSKPLTFIKGTSVPRKLKKGGDHIHVRDGAVISKALYGKIAATAEHSALNKLKGEIHHVLPLYLGGGNEADNLVVVEGHAAYDKNKSKLLSHFGDADAIVKANAAEVARVADISPTEAQSIIDAIKAQKAGTETVNIDIDAAAETAHAALHELIDDKNIGDFLNDDEQVVKLSWSDISKQFKDTDLKIFIGVASDDGRIKYHETDLSYLLSSS